VLPVALEELLGRRVDLLTPKCLRPDIEAEIEREAIHIP
jgi:predicted nucleotidyltransferase